MTAARVLSFAALVGATAALATDDLGGASRGYVVALDVGHGSSSPGATSARGVPEFEFNRTLAAELQEAIDARGEGRAYLIGDRGDLGGSEGLRARSGLAAKAGASLLVSVHHDSVQPQYLERWIVGAGKEGRFSDRFSGYSIFFAKNAPEAGKSLAFAVVLGDELLAEALRPSLHHAENIPGEGRELVDARRGIYAADFAVLQSAKMPAVLLEAGVIVNRDEELALSRPEYRARIARAVARAVSRFMREGAQGTGGSAR